MKKNTHPVYTPLTILMNNGDKFPTKSTYKGDTYLVDVYFKNHPAWKGGVASVNTNANQVSQFNKKFGSLFSMGPKASE